MYSVLYAFCQTTKMSSIFSDTSNFFFIHLKIAVLPCTCRIHLDQILKKCLVRPETSLSTIRCFFSGQKLWRVYEGSQGASEGSRYEPEYHAISQRHLRLGEDFLGVLFFTFLRNLWQETTFFFMIFSGDDEESGGTGAEHHFESGGSEEHFRQARKWCSDRRRISLELKEPEGTLENVQCREKWKKRICCPDFLLHRDQVTSTKRKTKLSVIKE